jgi:glycosyltransferase involved in cell wall biosynthesis
VPHFNAPIFCCSKLIVTIHDLIYLKEKRFSGSVFAGLYVRALIAGIQRHARAVIAVSDFTRRDLEETFPALEGMVTVIYEAASRIFAPNTAQVNIKKFGLGGDYVLFVGSLKAHKNLPVLLDAFESLRAEGNTSVKLAIVGRKDVKETALLERLERSTAYVCYLGEQADEDLAAIYRGAHALVIPSLWEGFGLTALEAMACGTPVISSNRASLPEVVGDAGLLFDPSQTEALKEHLGNVLKSAELRTTLSRKGLERAKQFSWDIAARETLDAYKEAMA